MLTHVKILFITSRFPYPPFRGDKIRVFNLIKELSRDHEIVLATFADPDDGQYYADLREYVTRIEAVRLNKTRAYLNCLIHPFSKTPLQVFYYRSAEMSKTVARLVEEEKPDAIHCHLIRMAPYAVAYPKIPKVLDICDSMTLNYDRFLTFRRDVIAPLYKFEKSRTAAYETTIPALFDMNTVVSTHDRDFIADLNSEAPLAILPMGVEFDYFKPTEYALEANRVAFMGTMSYFPNIDGVKWFTRDILPIVQRTLPETEFCVVGSNPVPEILKLEDDKSVTVTGFVDDVRPFVGPAAVFVCPIRAATGFNTKVIEAMAMGLPVVATPSACEGIDVTDGVNIMLADQPMDFAEAVITLLRDEPTRQAIAAAGRELVLEKYSWITAGNILRQVYKDIGGNRL